MRALLSAVGTRGDVQPIIALAEQLRALGHDVRLCVPPNFVDLVRARGFDAHAVGIEMRAPAPGAKPAPVPDLIANQFEAVGAAAEGCAVILGANAHQYAARSIAELRRVPYVTALYAPVAIPSPHLPPPPTPGQPWEPSHPTTHLQLWAANTAAWNQRALARVNDNRASLGLGPIEDVLRFNITEHPWLAVDPALAPFSDVFTTGAWVLEDLTPLPTELERFLATGPRPLYFGFGSMPVAPELPQALIEAGRALGMRMIISRGWAGMKLIDAGDDCIAIDDVNQQALFPRVAAVVHHGGAGTTATSARAAAAQLVLPLFGDQFYWGDRIAALGLGAVVSAERSVAAIVAALRVALDPAVHTRTSAFSQRLASNGAAVAAARLVSLTA